MPMATAKGNRKRLLPATSARKRFDSAHGEGSQKLKHTNRAKSRAISHQAPASAPRERAAQSSRRRTSRSGRSIGQASHRQCGAVGRRPASQVPISCGLGRWGAFQALPGRVGGLLAQPGSFHPIPKHERKRPCCPVRSRAGRSPRQVIFEAGAAAAKVSRRTQPNRLPPRPAPAGW